MVPLHYGTHRHEHVDDGGRRLLVPMPQQPDLISPSYSASPAPGETPVAEEQPQAESTPPQPSQHERIPQWLVRAELYLRVLVRMYIGLAVCFFPWSSFFWDQNPLFFHFPNLAAIAANGAVKGLISGIGLLNLWIALQDAMHYRGQIDHE
jgi:hypothetical protein